MFISPFVFCLCFSLIKESFASFNILNNDNSLNKRQAIASRTCGDQNNTVSICSPSSTSVWSNNTDQEITWKYNNPTFDQYTQLDLYLLYQNSSSSSSGNYETIKTWLGLEKSKGITVQHIDNSWYPSPIKDNSPNVTWTMFMYIVGAGYDIQTDLDLIPTAHNFFPVPQSFTLIQNARNTTTTTSQPTGTNSSPTVTGTTASIPTPANPSTSKKLPGWAIAVIVIAALLFILATAALIWAYKRYKNKKQMNGGTLNSRGQHNDDEKIPVLTPNKNESNIAVAAVPHNPNTAATADNNRGDISSIHSSTQQLWSPRSLSPRHDEISFITTSEKPNQQQQQQAQQLGLHSEANQSSSILSSTDALMIADTFRQFMRKPDWNEELELNEKKRVLSLKKTDN